MKLFDTFSYCASTRSLVAFTILRSESIPCSILFEALLVVRGQNIKKKSNNYTSAIRPDTATRCMPDNKVARLEP